MSLFSAVLIQSQSGLLRLLELCLLTRGCDFAFVFWLDLTDLVAILRLFSAMLVRSMDFSDSVSALGYARL